MKYAYKIGITFGEIAGCSIILISIVCVCVCVCVDKKSVI